MDSRYYELEKIAYTSPSMLKRVGRLIKRNLPTVQGTKRFLIGNPRRFAHEVRTGKALERGGMLRESFTEDFRDPLTAGLIYGLPAYDAISIATDPNIQNKGSRIGGLLGGTALSMGLFRPLGLLGSSVAGSLGENIGSTLGSLGENKKRVGLLQQY